MVTTNFDLKSTAGVRSVRALCSCLGTSITALRMVKVGSVQNTVPIVAISRMSKTVAQPSQVLDELTNYNLVVRTQPMHCKNKSDIQYTYTVTGFGLSVLSELFGVQFHLMNRV